MKRSIVLALIIALVVGPVSVPLAAKKRKKRLVGVTQEFHLRKDYETECLGGLDEDYKDVYFLSTEYAPHHWNEDCSDDAETALLAELQGRLGFKGPRAFPAVDGVPFVLDATRPMIGNITLWGSGAGLATATVVVFAETSNGKELELGQFEETFDVLPKVGCGAASPVCWPPHFYEFRIDLDASLDRRVLDAFRIELHCCGDTAVFPHRVEFEGPLRSFVKVPIWVRR